MMCFGGLNSPIQHGSHRERFNCSQVIVANLGAFGPLISIELAFDFRSGVRRC